MLKYSIVALLGASLMAAATPVAEAQPDPVAPAPAASSSVTPSVLYGTLYFASMDCMSTSSTTSVHEGQCLNLSYDNTGDNSYTTSFNRGTDFPGDSCTVHFYSTDDCSGPVTSSVPAGSLTGACKAETHDVSVKFSC